MMVKVKNINLKKTGANNIECVQVYCKCDRIFYDCLKKQRSTLADLIGQVYVNSNTKLLTCCVEKNIKNDI